MDVLCGLTSDGTKGLAEYLSWALEWVNHQRCIFHLWRLVSGELAREASLAAAGQVEALLVHRKAFNRGLGRMVPEWCWRDFPLRLSRGRNHGSEVRLKRAAVLWAIYRNCEPAQGQSERKRRYRHPGLSPLAMAEVAPGEVSCLDALGV